MYVFDVLAHTCLSQTHLQFHLTSSQVRVIFNRDYSHIQKCAWIQLHVTLRLMTLWYLFSRHFNGSAEFLNHLKLTCCTSIVRMECGNSTSPISQNMSLCYYFSNVISATETGISMLTSHFHPCHETHISESHSQTQAHGWHDTGARSAMCAIFHPGKIC